ncbi:MAG: oligoribonuclease [Propionibacteriaceae bacterium]|nr:oligoribonuclease [Propionibacteriaceae bacterium]
MENLVWIDCEMTGLDMAGDALIEVAALVTDADLNVLGEGVDVIIKPPAGALESMDPFVTQMHTTSGLITELDAGLDMATAEIQVMEYIRAWIPEAGKSPLCGNTISTDRAFLRRDMPTLEGYLHYRNIDVSSLKELVRRWYPRVFFSAPEKTGNHRALGDIKDSINELRYYRQTVMVGLPGPSRDEAVAIAKRLAPFTNQVPEAE